MQHYSTQFYLAFERAETHKRVGNEAGVAQFACWAPESPGPAPARVRDPAAWEAWLGATDDYGAFVLASVLQRLPPGDGWDMLAAAPAEARLAAAIALYAVHEGGTAMVPHAPAEAAARLAAYEPSGTLQTDMDRLVELLTARYVWGPPLERPVAE